MIGDVLPRERASSLGLVPMWVERQRINDLVLPPSPSLFLGRDTFPSQHVGRSEGKLLEKEWIQNCAVN